MGKLKTSHEQNENTKTTNAKEGGVKDRWAKTKPKLIKSKPAAPLTAALHCYSVPTSRIHPFGHLFSYHHPQAFVVRKKRNREIQEWNERTKKRNYAKAKLYTTERKPSERKMNRKKKYVYAYTTHPTPPAPPSASQPEARLNNIRSLALSRGT